MLEGQGNTGLQEKVRAHSQSCDWYPKHYHGNRPVEQALHLKPYTLGSSTAADQKLKVQLIQALCRLKVSSVPYTRLNKHERLTSASSVWRGFKAQGVFPGREGLTVLGCWRIFT